MTEMLVEPQAAPIEIASMVQQLEAAGAMTPVALTLPVVPYDRWEAVGRWLGAVNRASSFWIGDWLIAGETLFGEESAQAIEATTSERYDVTQRITGLAHQTLLNSSSVCRRVPAARRREELSFGHHSVVAPLEPDAQSLWLQRAIDEGWGVADFRAAIREASRPGDPDPGDPDPNPTPAPLQVGERIEQAASAVYTSAQSTGRGVHEVPDPEIHTLGTALGRE